MTYPKEREIDGAYFRVQRDGVWYNICFTDLTEEEQKGIITGRESEWMQGMILHLAKALRRVADVLDLGIADDDG